MTTNNFQTIKIPTGVTGKFIEVTAEIGSPEWKEAFIVSEVKKVANRSARTSTFNFDETDLESYVTIRVWTYVTTKYDETINPNIEAYIRGLIKQFTMNFLKSPNNVHTDVDSFSSLSSTDGEGNESDFESTYEDTSVVSIEESVCEQTLTNGFMDTLSDRHRTIVELRAGILDNLSADQLLIALEIMDKQASKKGYGEVYLSNSDIAKIVGIHRNHVTKNIDKIVEQALDFGLED